MTDSWSRDGLDDYALETSVGLLDALLDAAVAAEPGRNAGRYAAELSALGHSAALAASDLAAIAPEMDDASTPWPTARRAAIR